MNFEDKDLQQQVVDSFNQACGERAEKMAIAYKHELDAKDKEIEQLKSKLAAAEKLLTPLGNTFFIDPQLHFEIQDAAKDLQPLANAHNAEQQRIGAERERARVIKTIQEFKCDWGCADPSNICESTVDELLKALQEKEGE